MDFRIYLVQYLQFEENKTRSQVPRGVSLNWASSKHTTVRLTRISSLEFLDYGWKEERSPLLPYLQKLSKFVLFLSLWFMIMFVEGLNTNVKSKKSD